MTTDLRNFRYFIHKIQLVKTHLKVTYLQMLECCHLLLFTCTMFLGQT